MIYPAPRLLRIAVAPALLSLLAVTRVAPAAFAWGAWWLTIAVAAFDAWLVVRGRAPSLACVLPARARVGAPCELRYELEGLQPATDVTLLDELPEDLGGDHWESWKTERSAPGAGPAALSERRELQVTPTRRGLRNLGPSYLFWASPLRLWRRALRVEHARELPVMPEDTLPPRSGLHPKRTRAELGLRPRRPRGEGTDFESLRDYTLDDEPRKIDWRASARVGRPVVRNHHVERSHTLLVAVDCGRLMSARVAGQSKLDHALSAALSLVRASRSSGDRVGFAAFDRELRAWVGPAPPHRAVAPIVEATLPLEPRSDEPSYRALSAVLRERQRKRALVVVLTDFVEGGASVELETQLTILAKRHCVVLVGLRDPLLGSLERPAPHLDSSELYRRLVLQDLEVARKKTLARIAKLGVHTLDLDPAAVTLPLLDRYLAIREAGLV